MFPITLALISYFSWAVGDIFGTVAARKLGGLSTTFWSLFLRVIIFSLYIPFALSQLQELTIGLFLFILLIGFIAVTGFICFNEGLRIGSAVVVGTVAAAFPFIAVILSLIFLKEKLTFEQTLAIIIIFIGVTLSSLDIKLFTKKRTIHKGVGLALIAMVSWGIWYAFIKIPVQKIGWFWPTYIVYCVFPFVFLFMKIQKVKLVSFTHQKAALPLIISVLLLGTAEASYNLGIARANASIMAPIAGSYPTLFVLLAFLIFKDPIRKQQIVGIVTTLCGIVLLSFFSV